MPQKYMALLMICCGIASLVAAVRMNRHASFEGGTFIYEIGFGLLGGALLLGGLLWMLVLLFLEL